MLSQNHPRIDFWTGALAGATLLLGVALWSSRRHRSPTLKIECDAPIDRMIPTLSGLTLGTALPGNSVEVIENGRYFDVLVDCIGRARRSVHFETFLWKPGDAGWRVARALAERARGGVKVRVMLDAIGSKKVPKEIVRFLCDAGCRLQFFHNRSLYNLGVLTDRDHRKIAVFDGREALVGGHCITDEWLGDAEDGEHFSDVSVLLRGPIVHTVQSAFSENWAGETGELFVGEDVFPELEPAGDALIHASFVKPENSAPAVKILHHTVICMARERLWIQNPYFIPEPDAIDAMGQAVRRGVDVRVLTPSVGGSDNPMVQHAGHRNFGKLLKAGVRLFEYPHTLLHQKVVTVDGQWCAVGSTNFDDRSFDTNDEITLGILHPPTAKRLEQVFERYAARAREVTLDDWRHRPLAARLKENAVYLVKEVL